MREAALTRRMLLISFLLVALGPTVAAANDNPLLGTWRLNSFVREVAGTGERYNQMGEHPDGYISYAADGRMLVFFVSNEQPRPRAEPTDEERIRLHKAMLAYGGTYTLSPGKVVHHIDIERLLFNDFESSGDRVGGSDLILFAGKHPANDPTDCVVIVYH